MSLDAFCHYLEEQGRSPATVYQYRSGLVALLRACSQGDAWHVDAAALRTYLDERSVHYRKQLCTAYRAYREYALTLGHDLPVIPAAGTAERSEIECALGNLGMLPQVLITMRWNHVRWHRLEARVPPVLPAASYLQLAGDARGQWTQATPMQRECLFVLWKLAASSGHVTLDQVNAQGFVSSNAQVVPTMYHARLATIARNARAGLLPLMYQPIPLEEWPHNPSAFEEAQVGVLPKSASVMQPPVAPKLPPVDAVEHARRVEVARQEVLAKGRILTSEDEAFIRSSIKRQMETEATQ